jgi:hypothetical protein
MRKEGSAAEAIEYIGYPECKVPEGFLDLANGLSGQIIIEKINPYEEFLKHIFSNQANNPKEEKKIS